MPTLESRAQHAFDNAPATDSIKTIMAAFARAYAADSVERAAGVAHKRSDGHHTGGCERGHTEWDTNAFVCSARGDCLCAEREEEAESIETEILALAARIREGKE